MAKLHKSHAAQLHRRPPIQPVQWGPLLISLGHLKDCTFSGWQPLVPLQLDILIAQVPSFVSSSQRTSSTTSTTSGQTAPATGATSGPH